MSGKESFIAEPPTGEAVAEVDAACLEEDGYVAGLVLGFGAGA